MAVSHLRNLFSNYTNKPNKRRTSPNLQSANDTIKRRQQSAPYEGSRSSPPLTIGRFSSSQGPSEFQREELRAQTADRGWFWNYDKKSPRLQLDSEKNDDKSDSQRVRRESGTSVAARYRKVGGNTLVCHL